MSGLSGFIDHNNWITAIDFNTVSSKLANVNSTGTGLYFDRKAHYCLALSNERLPTIDLSEEAAQPLHSNCGNFIITINGTIYNFLELRETLIKYGVIFSTLSDTEVVLECYKKWGTKAFEKLDGSYAFALLDKKNNLLLVGRDELGAKPLYYYKTEGFYAFSSEIKALLAFPAVKKVVNKAAMASFFRYGYFTGPATIYENIYQFPKGRLLTIDVHSGNSHETALTKFKLRPQVNAKESEAEVIKRIEELLTESILKRNVANTTVGVLLGSGYDSSTVAAILQKNQSKRIKTYTVGYKDSKLDEAPRARKIATHLKTNHQEFYMDQDTALEIVKLLPHIFDEPVGDSSAIPMAFVANQVHHDAHVLIGSEGGDELFGGHRSYAKVLKINRLKRAALPKLLKRAMLGFIKTTQPELKEVIAAPDLMNEYLAINACFTVEEVNKLLHSDTDFNEQTSLADETIKGLLIHDLHHYLPNNILAKNDRCFRYFGVENRDAMLKTELVDYLSTLDPELFLKDGEQKYLLKQITHQYIPKSIMQQAKKGLVIPLASWLNTSLKHLVAYYLSAPKLKEHSLLDLRVVEKIKEAFYENGTVHHAQKLWLVLQFQMWYEKWMSEN